MHYPCASGFHLWLKILRFIFYFFWGMSASRLSGNSVAPRFNRSSGLGILRNLHYLASRRTPGRSMDFLRHYLLTILLIIPAAGTIAVLFVRGNAIRWTALGITLGAFAASLLLLLAFDWHAGGRY